MSHSFCIKCAECNAKSHLSSGALACPALIPPAGNPSPHPLRGPMPLSLFLSPCLPRMSCLTSTPVSSHQFPNPFSSRFPCPPLACAARPPCLLFEFSSPPLPFAWLPVEPPDSSPMNILLIRLKLEQPIFRPHKPVQICLFACLLLSVQSLGSNLTKRKATKASNYLLQVPFILVSSKGSSHLRSLRLRTLGPLGASKACMQAVDLRFVEQIRRVSQNRDFTFEENRISRKQSLSETNNR
jgi:hypothetical protein